MLCLTLMLPTLAFATDPVKVGQELLVPVAENWSVDGSTETFPCRLVRDDESAEILFFRTALEGDNQVNSELELKAAVDTVIANVILDLPGGEVLASTGLAESGWAQFVIDFESFDAVRVITLQHRFVGLLYRIDDGRQHLYTVWAKAPKELFEELRPELRNIQDNVVYTGMRIEPVFARRSSMTWLPIVGLLLAVFLLFYPRFSRSRRTATAGADSPKTGSTRPVRHHD